MNMKEFIKFLLGTLFVMSGASLCARLNLGIATYDSFVLNSSIALDFTYGFINISVGFCFILIQFLIIKKVEWLRFKQMFFLLIGSVIYDIFYYTIFKDLVIGNIIFKWGLFMIGNILMSIGIATITSLEFETYPLETTMNLINKKYNLSMSTIKYGLDFICLFLSLGVCFMFSLKDFNIGIGTIVFLLTQGMLIGYFHKIIKNAGRKAK